MTNNTIEQRLQKVVGFIDDNLHDSLSLQQLAGRANVSPYHFHRLFRYFFKLPVYEYIQRKRLLHAGYQLAVYPERPITEIATSACYENSESFSRAFKKVFRQTPSQFRAQPFSPIWRNLIQTTSIGEPTIMQVDIVQFPETKIALLVHCGPEEEEMKSVSQFIAWRRENGFTPKNSETYGIFYSDPRTTAPREYRFGIAGAVTEDIVENSFGVHNANIPGGRCAKVRQIGSPNNVEPSMRYLYQDWLPTSGEELGDFPPFVHRVSLASQVPDKDAITDVYLPLR